MTARVWASIAVVGLVGNLAWTAESIYLNLFVYDTISDNPQVIAAMVAASATTATVGTVVFGAVSDRLGRRRLFLSGAFVLWGLSTMTFGLVTVDGVAHLVPVADAVLVTVVAIILLDCVMSLFGAAAFSSTFMAWVTDVTTTGNRGRVEGLLVTLPPLSIVVAIALLGHFSPRGDWQGLFALIGLIMVVAGLAAAVLVRDAASIRPQRDGLVKAITHGLRPSTVRLNPRLYLAILAFAIAGIATSTFMPFFFIYVQYYLRIEGYTVLFAAALAAAAAISLLGGRLIDRLGKVAVLLPAAGVYALGLVLMFFARETVPALLCGVVVLSGFMLVFACCGGLIRDYTPRDRVGSVQGVRTILSTLPPALIGPFIGAAVITGADEYYIEFGVEKLVPTPTIFLAAACALVLIVIPAILLRRAGTSALGSEPDPTPTPGLRG